MRNRAKCKLCSDIIESIETYDYVKCSCGEIGIDGGTKWMRALARDFANFLRVDDEGNERPVSFVDKPPESQEPAEEQEKPIEPSLSKKEKVDMLKGLSDSIDNLPKHAMQAPITHYDYQSLILLLFSILRED